MIYCLTRQTGSAFQLTFQSNTVRHHNDLEALQIRKGPHLADKKNHSQALSRPLGMPDDPASLVNIPALSSGLARPEPVDGLVNGTELLVPADNFALSSLDLIEKDEIPDDVHQVLLAKHAGNEYFLAV